MISHIGIDFGARYAGTTAICHVDNGCLRVVQSVKKQDADEFCRQMISRLKPDFVMIDAPLSLPAAYFRQVSPDDNPDADFFFRQADRQLKAMSPMFLGGLTARAMQLAFYFRRMEIPFYETWPTYIRKYFGSAERPQAGLLDAELRKATGMGLQDELQLSPHGIDSILAWYAGWIKIRGVSAVYGNQTEGLVWC